MSRSVTKLAFALLLSATVGMSVHGQDTVNDPTVVMDLEWDIGAWTDIWKIGEFESAAVNSNVSYYIYLPPGYQDNDLRYPVVYWLHGAYGRPYSATPVARRLDAAIRESGSPQMILVSCFDPTGLSMWTNSKDGRLPMETIIVDELIAHIDSNYRTLDDRSGRAIEGFSMGGYGAAFLGAKYNNLFSSVSVLAGALHTPDTFRALRRAIFDNVFSGDSDYALAHSPWQLIEDAAEEMRGNTNVRIFVGADDGLLEWNTKYHELIAELGIEHDWGIVPNSPHDLETVMQNWEGDFFDYYRRIFAGSLPGGMQ